MREQFVPGSCGASELDGGRREAEGRKGGGLVKRKADRMPGRVGEDVEREKRSGHVFIVVDRHQKTLSLGFETELWPCLMQLLKDCSGFLR